MSLDDLLNQPVVPDTSGAAGVFIAGTDPETGLPIIVHQIFDQGTHSPPLKSLLFPISDPEGEIPLELPIQEDLQRERESLAYLMGVLRGLYQRCVAYESQMPTLDVTDKPPPET